MKSFNLMLADKLRLVVIPDSETHLDGHPVLTYSYSIYRDAGNSTSAAINKKNDQLHLQTQDDPNYMGVILFELPDRLLLMKRE